MNPPSAFGNIGASVANGIFATTRPNYTGQPVKLNQKGFIDTGHNTGPLYLNPAAFTHVPYTSNHKVALTTGNVPSILPGIQGSVETPMV